MSRALRRATWQIVHTYELSLSTTHKQQRTINKQTQHFPYTYKQILTYYLHSLANDATLH